MLPRCSNLTARACCRRGSDGDSRRGGRDGVGGGDGGAAVPITPDTIGFTYWLRPDSLAAGAASSYAPRTGTGTLVQATGANQPVKSDTVLLLGNKEGLLFDGTDKMAVASTYVVPLTTWTVVFYGYRTGASTYYAGQLSASGGRYWQINPTTIRLEDGVNTYVSSALTSANVGSYGMTMATDGTLKFWVNGVQLGASQATVRTASGAAGQFILGDPGGPGWTGYMADFCTAGREMSAAEMLSFHVDYAAPRYA